MKIEIGTYKHFKGGLYQVLHIGKHSETLEDVVVYKTPSGIWVRPTKMWHDTVEFSGNKVPRFELVGLSQKRITTIVTFDDATNETIGALTKNYFCKVPTMIENRQQVDTLPPHITIQENEVPDFDLTKNILFCAIEMKESKKGGFGIFLLTSNDDTHAEHKKHITLAIFDTHEQAQNEFEQCKVKFKPFQATPKSIEQYEIYPARYVKAIKD